MDLTVTFFNTLAIPRRGVQTITVDVPHIALGGDFYVEPCSGAGPLIDEYNPDECVSYDYFDIVDEKGDEVSHVLLDGLHRQ